MDRRGSSRMTDEYRDFLSKQFEAQTGADPVKKESEAVPGKNVVLNGARMRSDKGAHAYISRKLKFPSYYGNNLDALYDMLSTLGEPMTITIKNTQKLRSKLGDYGQAILNTFSDAKKANANIKVIETD